MLAAVLVLASEARAAEPANDEVKSHVRKAIATYNLGKYAEAAKEYEAAYEMTLDQNMLFNVAQCYRLSGEREKAITAYRSFIRTAPASEQRDLAKSKLLELEEQRRTVPGTSPAPPAAQPVPAPAVAVPVPAPTTPPPAAVAPTTPPTVVPPGASSGTAPAPSQNLSSGLVATPGPEPQEASPFYKRWPFWTGVGAVVAGGIVLGVVLTRGGNNLNMNPSLGTKDF